MFYLIFEDLRWWKKRFWFHKCWENTIWGQHWRLQIYLWWLKLFSDQRMDYKYLSRKELCDVNLNLFENWDDNYIIEKDCTLFSWFCTALLLVVYPTKIFWELSSPSPKSPFQETEGDNKINGPPHPPPLYKKSTNTNQGQCQDMFTSSGTKRIKYYDVSPNQFFTGFLLLHTATQQCNWNVTSLYDVCYLHVAW